MKTIQRGGMKKKKKKNNFQLDKNQKIKNWDRSGKNTARKRNHKKKDTRNNYGYISMRGRKKKKNSPRMKILFKRERPLDLQKV